MTVGLSWYGRYVCGLTIAILAMGAWFDGLAQPSGLSAAPFTEASHRPSAQIPSSALTVVQGDRRATQSNEPQLSISTEHQRLRGALGDFLINDHQLERQQAISNALGAAKVKPGADQDMIRLDLDVRLFDDRLRTESQFTTIGRVVRDREADALDPGLRAVEQLDHGTDQRHRLRLDLWRGDKSSISLSTAYGAIRPSYDHGWGRLDGDRENLQLGAGLDTHGWRLRLGTQMTAMGGDDYSRQGQRRARHSAELDVPIGDAIADAIALGPLQPIRMTFSGSVKETERSDRKQRPGLEPSALFTGLAEPDKRETGIQFGLGWQRGGSHTEFGLGRTFVEAASEGQLHPAGSQDEVSLAQSYGTDELQLLGKLTLQIGHDSGLRRGATFDTKVAWRRDDWPELNAGLKLVHQIKDNARPATRNRLEFAASADFAPLWRLDATRIKGGAAVAEPFINATLRFKLGGRWAAQGKEDHSDQLLLLLAGGWRF